MTGEMCVVVGYKNVPTAPLPKSTNLGRILESRFVNAFKEEAKDLASRLDGRIEWQSCGTTLSGKLDGRTCIALEHLYGHGN